MPINWEQMYKAAFKANVEAAPSMARAGKFKVKIENFCDIHGFTVADVVEAISNSKIVAAHFAVDPIKQNIYNNIAAGFIEQISEVTNFEMLQKRLLYISDGDVKKSSTLKKYPKSKSIDFSWNYRGAQLYALHKYAKQDGGAQDTQYENLQRFIDDANNVSQSNIYFIAIADGNFYNEIDNFVNTTRLEKLHNDADNETVFACVSEDLEELLKRITAE